VAERPDSVWGWITYGDPVEGTVQRLQEHLAYTGLAVVLACAVGLPLGLLLGHYGRFGALAINLTNIGRAVPTLGVIILFAISPIGADRLGIALALGLFALPVVLTNAYVGMREVDPETVEAARGMGMTERQVLTRVELPLAFPLVMAGIRSAVLQVFATAVLAAAVGGGGFGRYLVDGLGSRDYAQLRAGAFLVAGLALVIELALGGLQRLVDPVARSRRQPVTRTVEPEDPGRVTIAA
jgi:osmoprotectant transport system permease protein